MDVALPLPTLGVAPSGATVRPFRRRVLIVSPHFPPVEAPDHHRVRLTLPFLAGLGWTAEVLCVDPAFVERTPSEGASREFITEAIVHRVRARPLQQTRPWGWGSLARRAFRFLREAGDRLLCSGRFDLVFFSTTQFGVLSLGRDWRRRFGLPYVVDLQDEWVTAYYRGRRPPGGRLKFALAQGRARAEEQRVLPLAAAIIAVSPAYLQRVAERHPSIDPRRLHVLPFGAEAADFNQARNEPPPFLADGCRHWIYMGRGGDDLRPAARAFFAALCRAIDEKKIVEEQLRLHFIGTSYAVAGKPSFIPIAAEFGLAHLVNERTRRIPYPAALRWMQAADALLLFGSDDPAYNASKAFPCLLARKPLLALVHRGGPLLDLLRHDASVTTLSFDPAETPELLIEAILREWFAARAFARPVSPELPSGILTASQMTHALVRIFDQACAGKIAA